jgi:flagellar basal-body rod protein FlgC
MTGIDRLFRGMRMSASAIKAERTRVDTIAKNIANAQTTFTPETGEAYRREVVHFEPLLEKLAGGKTEVIGVRVKEIAKDYSTSFEEIFDPGHPDAGPDGIVKLPNINTMAEMADLITAVRAYEANLGVQDSLERMAERGLRLAE